MTPPGSESTPGSPDRPRQSGQPEQIGSYRILSELGQGGMGVVYLAEQSQPVRRRVALKLIKLGMDTREVVARFQAERQALAILDHPCVAKVFDGGASEGGRPYFVMELVEGPPITRYCEEHALGIEARLELFARVCAAIQHAHQKGVIHRDIKPSNVLVTMSDGQPMPKVIDFGVAKATAASLTEKSFHTEVGQLVGTVEYMSPEQVELTSTDIDTRTDIYSLGVLLYELLTGTQPFEAAVLRSAGLVEVRRIICEEDPARPSTRVARLEAAGDRTTALGDSTGPGLARKLRGELDWIVMKALEKERSRRYASAEELRRDVESYLHGTSVAARPPSVAYQLRVFARRNRAFVVGAAAVFLALAAGAVVSYRLYREERAARADEEHQRRLAEEARGAETRARERAETLAAEAEAQRVLAERNARIALEVNRFLNDDLLGAASPELTGAPYDPDIGVRELLDRAAIAVEAGAARDALVEASLRDTLGSTYRALGSFDRARVQLERALELRTAELGPEAPEVLTLRTRLGGLLYDQGEYAASHAILESTLADLERTQGADAPETLRAASALGFVQMAEGDETAGEVRITRALQAARRLEATPSSAPGAEPSLVPAFASNLARLYLVQRRRDEAVGLFAEALAGFEADLGPDHPTTLMTRGNLAALHNSLGNFEDAMPLIEQVLDTQRRILGEDHPDTLTTLNNYAFNLDKRGRVEEARELYQEVLERRVDVLGREHPHVLASMSNLGGAHRKLGDLEASAAVLEESLALHLEVVGPDHRDTQYARTDLSVTYEAQGRMEEAAELLAEAAEGARVGMPGDASFPVGCLVRRARYLRALGRVEEALVSLLAAAELAERELGLAHAYARNAVGVLAATYRELGDEDRASAWETKLEGGR